MSPKWQTMSGLEALTVSNVGAFEIRFGSSSEPDPGVVGARPASPIVATVCDQGVPTGACVRNRPFVAVSRTPLSSTP
jgi:hypothetical protein